MSNTASNSDIVKRAVAAAGGAAALGVALGISSQAISQWSRIPSDRIIAVEAASGIPRDELRPDLYAPAKSPEAA